MKWLVLQLLTLYCLVITPVTGGVKQRVEFVKKPPIYIVRPPAPSCVTVPSYYDCRNKCEIQWDCIPGYECCFSNCGRICMKMEETETTTKNNNPRTMVASTVALTSSEMLSTPEWEHTNST